MTDSDTATTTRLLFLHAQTPLHPGSGTALGVVDLPVQRERHTEWPLVPGSAIKGILRDACRRAHGNDEDLFSAFGPETNEEDKHAGALSVTDARILAFPVRSLCGVFAWTTCPAVLQRLARDLALAGHTSPPFDAAQTIPQPAKDHLACGDDSPLLVDGRTVVLEEFDFQRDGDATAIADWIAENATGDEYTRKRIPSHLVVLHDDDFTHFVRHATEVVARIGLDYERKTVKQGALFYQEFLPADTLFYCLVFANASRRKSHGKPAAEIMEYLATNLPSVLQVGGDETTGKGICAVRLV